MPFTVNQWVANYDYLVFTCMILANHLLNMIAKTVLADATIASPTPLAWIAWMDMFSSPQLSADNAQHTFPVAAHASTDHPALPATPITSWPAQQHAFNARLFTEQAALPVTQLNAMAVIMDMVGTVHHVYFWLFFSHDVMRFMQHYSKLCLLWHRSPLLYVHSVFFQELLHSYIYF